MKKYKTPNSLFAAIGAAARWNLDAPIDKRTKQTLSELSAKANKARWKGKTKAQRKAATAKATAARMAKRKLAVDL